MFSGHLAVCPVQIQALKTGCAFHGFHFFQKKFYLENRCL